MLMKIGKYKELVTAGYRLYATSRPLISALPFNLGIIVHNLTYQNYLFIM